MSKAVLMAAAIFLTAALPAHAQTYWRLDVGYSKQAGDADFKDNDFNQAGNILADNTFTQPGTLDNIDGSAIVGAGVGYRFTTGLRGDVTLVYRGFYSLNDTTFEASYSANITSTTLMVNGYYDFTGGGIVPYFGVGIGYARNETKTLYQDFGLGFVNRFAGATKDNVALAVMAGVGIPYSGWTLDLGYRYIDLGEFETAARAELGITSGHKGNLTAHEFTVGVRF
jgi:opacity protein-like surface antigen